MDWADAFQAHPLNDKRLKSPRVKKNEKIFFISLTSQLCDVLISNDRNLFLSYSHRELKIAPTAQCPPAFESLKRPSEKAGWPHIPNLEEKISDLGSYVNRDMPTIIRR